jgi:hypothetical protein
MLIIASVGVGVITPIAAIESIAASESTAAETLEAPTEPAPETTKSTAAETSKSTAAKAAKPAAAEASSAEAAAMETATAAVKSATAAAKAATSAASTRPGVIWNQTRGHQDGRCEPDQTVPNHGILLTLESRVPPMAFSSDAAPTATSTRRENARRLALALDLDQA